MGPAWECEPETLPNGRVIYRCSYGHMHGNDSAAWSCGDDDRDGVLPTLLAALREGR